MQVFDGYEFHSVASLSEKVPVLSCGGLSKNLMIPGWRIGWILIHDRNGAFQQEVGIICHYGCLDVFPGLPTVQFHSATCAL